MISIKAHKKNLLDKENEIVVVLAAIDSALRLFAPYDCREALQVIDELNKAGASLKAKLPWRPSPPLTTSVRQKSS